MVCVPISKVRIATYQCLPPQPFCSDIPYRGNFDAEIAIPSPKRSSFFRDCHINSRTFLGPTPPMTPRISLGPTPGGMDIFSPAEVPIASCYCLRPPTYHLLPLFITVHLFHQIPPTKGLFRVSGPDTFVHYVQIKKCICCT
jgi:hypothetical protein